MYRLFSLNLFYGISNMCFEVLDIRYLIYFVLFVKKKKIKKHLTKEVK